jgi:hypothetical protein
MQQQTDVETADFENMQSCPQSATLSPAAPAADGWLVAAASGCVDIGASRKEGKRGWLCVDCQLPWEAMLRVRRYQTL